MSKKTVRFSPERPPDYTMSEIIKEIRRVILDECKGSVPSQTRFLQLARFSLRTIKTRFGTYELAIQKAGFVYKSVRAKYTPECVTANLCEVLSQNDGYCFTYAFYKKHGGSFSFQTIKSILNTPKWAGVMKIIGAKQQPYIVRTTARAQRRKAFAKLTESEMLSEIKRVWKVVGRRPTYTEFRDKSQFGTKIYESIFGSWVKAIEAFCSNQKTRIQGKSGTCVTKKILSDELRELQHKRPGDLLTYNFYKASGGTYSIGTFQNHFGSWTKAVQAVDGISGKQAKYTKDELFDEMQRLWEQLGKQPSWAKMWRDGNISPRCYKSMFGSWSKAVHAFCEDRNELLPDVPREPVADDNNLALEVEAETSVTIPNADSGELTQIRKTGRSVSKRLRFRVLRRDKFTCQACGRSPSKDNVVLEIDHIKAYSNGGETVIENLQALCKDCNSGKSNL